VALNNLLYTIDEKERLQELLDVTSRLYVYSSRQGSLTLWQDQDLSHAEQREEAVHSQWEVVFRANAETMRLKSCGCLLDDYTASAA